LAPSFLFECDPLGAVFLLVLAVLQNFTEAEGFAPDHRREKPYPLYFKLVTRAA